MAFVPESPRVLHLNDCAFVGAHLVGAAARAGHRWRILTPERTWAPLRPGRTTTTRWDEYRTWARVASHVAAAQVVHAHFATTARRLKPWFVPRRPYVLHLHGTDIRSLWPDPVRGRAIQAYIDGAAHVYYSTPDNEANARTARPDAEYLPVFIEPRELPVWRPQGYVAFASRWDEVKGLEAMLEVAERLVAAGIEVRGLDWGPGAAEAARRGVALIPKAPHADYLRFLGGARVVVGQASRILSVSELEAMAIGVPLAAVGNHHLGPDGGPLPIREGSVGDVVDAVISDFSDPVAAEAELGSKHWTLTHHTADRYVPSVLQTYRRIVA